MTDAAGGMKLTRKPERGVSEKDALYAFLDSQLAGTLSTVADGLPLVVPVLYARDGDRILLHGSTGAGALGVAAGGAPVVFSVFLLEGLRVSYNGYHSSANYRSAVVEGVCEPLAGETHEAALGVLTGKLIPGRDREVPGPSRKESSATLVLSLPIRDGHWLHKVRGGEMQFSPEAGEVWMGYVPLPVVAGDPIPAAGQDPALPVPSSVLAAVAKHRP